MKNERHNSRWIKLGIVLILMVLIVQIVLTVKLSADVKSTIVEMRSQKSLPCAAIPTKYILQEPECADKLLRVMNVTNVRVVSEDRHDRWVD